MPFSAGGRRTCHFLPRQHAPNEPLAIHWQHVLPHRQDPVVLMARLVARLVLGVVPWMARRTMPRIVFLARHDRGEDRHRFLTALRLMKHVPDQRCVEVTERASEVLQERAARRRLQAGDFLAELKATHAAREARHDPVVQVTPSNFGN